MSKQDETVHLQKFKQVLQVLYDAAPEIRDNTECFDGNTYTKKSQRFCEVVNLETGVYRHEKTDLDSGELTLKYSGGSLNEAPNKAYVGMGIHKNPVGFEFVQSHIELMFTESLEYLTNDCLNKNAMDHLNLYIIFEINPRGGRCVEILKNDSSGVCAELYNYEWKDVVRALKRNKDYPIGIINEQKLHGSMAKPKASPKKKFGRAAPLLSKLQQSNVAAQGELYLSA